MATNVCISMACVFTIPTTVFLVPSSGVVYVILALGVSTLVRPPGRNHHISELDHDFVKVGNFKKLIEHEMYNEN